MSEEEQLRRSWIANAASWRDAVREQQIESRRVVTDAAIVDAVLQTKPRTVLDLGCGEGWLARALSARGVAVTGIDASPPLIDAANALGGGRFLAMRYADAAQALAGETFDAIVANFSFLDDGAADTLAAVAPLLAPAGRVVIQTVHPPTACGDLPYTDGWRTETFAALPGTWPEPMPWYFRTIESWFRVFADAGYVVAEVREPVDAGRGVVVSMIFVLSRGAS